MLGVIGALVVALAALSYYAKTVTEKKATLQETNRVLSSQLSEAADNIERSRIRAEALDAIIKARDIERDDITRHNRALQGEINRLRNYDNEASAYLGGIIPDNVINVLLCSVTATDARCTDTPAD